MDEKQKEMTQEQDIVATLKEIKTEIEKSKEDALTQEKVIQLFNDLYEKRKELDKPFIVKNPEQELENVGMLVKELFKGYNQKNFKGFLELRAKMVKDMSPDTNSAGGYLIPDQLLNTLIMPVVEDGNIDAMATVLNGVARTGHLNRVTSGTTVSRTAAGSSITGSEPTFAREDWAMTQGLKGLVAIPSELSEWSDIAVGNYIRQQFQIDLMKVQWAEFVIGTGTNQAKGLGQYTLTSIAQAGAKLDIVDLIKASVELPAVYQGNAKWFMRKDVYSYIMALKDSNGRPILLNDLINASTNKKTLLGIPVQFNDYIPNNLGTNTNESIVYLGDPKGYYKFHPKNGMRIDISDQFYYDKDELAVRLVLQDDGRLARTDSFVKITGVIIG